MRISNFATHRIGAGRIARNVSKGFSGFLGNAEGRAHEVMRPAGVVRDGGGWLAVVVASSHQESAFLAIVDVGSARRPGCPLADLECFGDAGQPERLACNLVVQHDPDFVAIGFHRPVSRSLVRPSSARHHHYTNSLRKVKPSFLGFLRRLASPTPLHRKPLHPVGPGPAEVLRRPFVRPRPRLAAIRPLSP